MEITIQQFDCRHEFLANGKLWLDAYGTLPGETLRTRVGCITLEQHSEWVWLNELFVIPQCRGLGIGFKLVRRSLVIGESTFAGTWGCCAGIRDSNERSRLLFERAGFRYVYKYEDHVCLYSKRFVPF